ncbi:hypothetical protein HWQ46_15500 [Shewanella sp. D64]|uniref:DUF6916 family protein n=1 Tax=unclassified Shewanella TaxID=196818 RepID=UPI0022BA2957|nr:MULTISPECIES: hypothetical protein [unclassified Shewanella]MEC4726958.1 hypothetical protein [Shewanella sp. D64]MEC4738545.1 hypothetical protein [Shewanella sp. E94]WBJ93763.1 hypothetical protein HWQ47_17765 [Shewanella sp. MTB7]
MTDLTPVIPPYQTFKQLIGRAVNVEDTQGNSLELILDEVVPGSAHSQNYESFTTRLKDTLPNRVPQGCYTFSHPMIGKQWLFCSAISATQYEIVINREAETKL